jgi:hypothetical protein
MKPRKRRIKADGPDRGSSSSVQGRPRRKRKGKPRVRRKRRSWFGLLKRAVAEDHEERGEPPELTEAQILAWADAFLERTGDWPSPKSGPIPEAPGETWFLVAAALALGLRGLPPGGSIPRFLEEHRGRYNCAAPKFTKAQILAWADDWYARTGDWPVVLSGEIPGSGGVNWRIVDLALRLGRGALPRGSSLCRFLKRERGVVRHPPLTQEQILEWAVAHHEQTGQWPNAESGPIIDAPDETWRAVNSALVNGLRGLRGDSSLAELLVSRLTIRINYYAPRLTIPQVLAWADAYRARTGRWPTCSSGRCLEAPGEHWASIVSAVKEGHRGLPGGSTFTQMLIKYRGHRSKGYAPKLLIPEILAWAEAFRARHGEWPKKNSGPVDEAPGETWSSIDAALHRGNRGLPGGSTLARLLKGERGVPVAGRVRPDGVVCLPARAESSGEVAEDVPRRAALDANHSDSLPFPGDEHTVTGALRQRRVTPGGDSLPALKGAL